MIDLSVESNREAYLHPAVQDIITNQPVDVVIVLPVLGNEAGYYLAQKKNASLVLFLTVPYTMPELSWAIGDPYSPSYMPHPLLGFTQDQRYILQWNFSFQNCNTEEKHHSNKFLEISPV